MRAPALYVCDARRAAARSSAGVRGGSPRAILATNLDPSSAIKNSTDFSCSSKRPSFKYWSVTNALNLGHLGYRRRL
jgi:hypothetical protein